MNFYGGRKGKDFSIRQVLFTVANNSSKKSLKDDLALGNTSSVKIGDFVMVSYGLLNSAEYIERQRIDDKAFKKNYNATLWEKILIDASESIAGIEIIDSGKGQGIAYKMISSLQGPAGNGDALVWNPGIS